MAARRIPTPSNEREPETSPWNTDPFPSPVRLAVGDDNDGELAMELAAEFAIELCVLKKNDSAQKSRIVQIRVWTNCR